MLMKIKPHQRNAFCFQEINVSSFVFNTGFYIAGLSMPCKGKLFDCWVVFLIYIHSKTSKGVIIIYIINRKQGD